MPALNTAHTAHCGPDQPQAEDDPIAPKEAIPFEAIEANPQCLLVLTPTGGHLGWCGGRGGTTGVFAWCGCGALGMALQAEQAAVTVGSAGVVPHPAAHPFRPTSSKGLNKPPDPLPCALQARPGRMRQWPSTSPRSSSCWRSRSLRRQQRRRRRGSHRRRSQRVCGPVGRPRTRLPDSSSSS